MCSAHDNWNSLSEIAELISPAASNRSEFIDECKSGKLDGALIAYRTFNSFAITGLIDQELVDVFPKSLKFLCHCGKLYLSVLQSEGPE